MNARGLSLVETLVSIAVAAAMSGILVTAMRTQGRNTLYQTGTADLQQNVRSALGLFRREVRMAGYGMSTVPAEDLPPIVLPTTADQYEVVLRGNYDNVRSRGSAPANGTTITLDPAAAPFPLFQPGERVAIESAILASSEVRIITAFDPGAGRLTVDAALDNAYDPGSSVTQLNEFTYRLDADNILWRDDQIVADQVSVLALDYVLADGASVADPAAALGLLRGATINMHAEQEARDGLKPEAGFQTEVRIRNLGIVRTPVAGT